MSKRKPEVFNSNRKHNSLWKKVIRIVKDNYPVISLVLVTSIFVYEHIENWIQESEFQKALVEELINEINFNLYVINDSESKQERYLTTYEFTYLRFSTAILEEAISYVKIGNFTVKKQMFQVYQEMSLQNRIMDRYKDIVYGTFQEQFMEQKKQDVNLLSRNNKKIKGHLEILKSGLQELYPKHSP